MGEECRYYYYDAGYSCALKKEKEGYSSISSDEVHRYCWGYHYEECPRYKQYSSSGGACYMTSACVEAKGLPDDCYELQTLRALVSAFEDGANIVPVKLEIKEFVDKKNSLYVAIALESIKKDEVVAQEVIENDVAPDARSSEVRIADLFAEINPIDESFLKYVPKQFLTQAPLSPGNAVFYQQRTSSRYISVQS